MGCKQSNNMRKRHKSYGDYDYGYEKDSYADEESSSSGSYNETSSGPDYDYSSGGGGGGRNPNRVINDVGTCWFKGITDSGIRYDYNTTGPEDMGTFITFLW
jgi:hypothetical protein